MLIGGALSPLAGPVDMLQRPKQLLMDGYRFQDAMFPPVDPTESAQFSRFPRLGVFAATAYIEGDSPHPQAGGGTGQGTDSAALVQITSRGQQDQYLLTKSGDLYEDVGANFLPWGKWVDYGSPLTATNGAFSWGDVLYRYRDDPEITIVPSQTPPGPPISTIPDQPPVQPSCWTQSRSTQS